MKNEETEKKIEDWCVECTKIVSRHEKINGVCMDCAKKLFKK